MIGASGIRAVAAALLATACTVLPAQATENAGTLSPFAYGAGNRALALGGAFTGIADDASALIWNPSGLGAIGRGELQFSRTSLDLGAQETFAAFALPSWKWGTLGVSFWHFGVGGIEERDERNRLLGSDLSDTEQEIALGWGRAMGAWSAGGAVKLQRQSLGGYSDMGLGADLGVSLKPFALLRPASGEVGPLTVGLALRNAVRPALRLDRDAVQDPTRVRGGLAWRTEWGLMAVDLEGGRGAPLRPRTGIELRPHGLLALRTGLNGGALTGGAGFRWQGLQVDYAYEDGPITPMHRVGVSFAVGRSVAQSREMALQREENRIRERLADGYRRIETQRIDSLAARSGTLLDQGRPAEALDVIAALATLRPDHPGLAALEARSLLASANALERQGDFAAAAATYRRALERSPGDSTAAQGERRSRGESDRRAARTRDIRAAFGAAMDAFGAGDLPRARRGFQNVLAVSPLDAEAAAMLRRVERAAASRLEQVLHQARWELGAGRPDGAARRLEEARALDPDAAAVAQMAAAIAQVRRGAAVHRTTEAAALRPAPAMADLSPQKRRELDDLYRRGLDALRQKRSEDAMRYWELVRSHAPDYPRIGESLVQEYLRRGLDLFAAGRLEEAVSLWEKALAIDPQDARARGYLERAQKQISRRRELLGAND